MHGSAHLGHSTAFALAVFYLLVVVMNLGYAAYQFYVNRDRKQGAIWGAVAGVFLIHTVLYLIASRWPDLADALMLPPGMREVTTRIMGALHGQAGPILYTILSVAVFVT